MANTYTDLLKLRMPALGDVGWDDEVNDNTMIQEFVFGPLLKSNVVIDGLVPSDGGGLDVDVTSGNVVVGGAQYAVGSGSKTCTQNLKNWLYVDSSGVLQISTTQPTGNYVALAMIDAGGTTIDQIADARNIAEGALTIGVTYTPDNYEADTSETGAINQHLAGLDQALGLLAGIENRIINGNFAIAQRGTSQTGNGYDSIDRYGFSGTGTTKTASQQTFTLGQTDVEGNPKHYLQVAVTSSAGSANRCLFYQGIEEVKTFAGGQAAISFDAKADSSKNIAIEFYQYFGSGGSPSSDITAIDVQTVPLTSSWQRIELTVDIPSISGKTIGTDGNDCLFIFIWLDAGSDWDSRTNSLGQQSGTFSFANLKMQEGPVATKFVERPPGLELLLCQRYFQGVHNGFHGDTTNGEYYGADVPYMTQMRATPTCDSVDVISAVGFYDPDTSSAAAIREDGFSARVQASVTNSGRYWRGRFWMDAEL